MAIREYINVIKGVVMGFKLWGQNPLLAKYLWDQVLIFAPFIGTISNFCGGSCPLCPHDNYTTECNLINIFLNCRIYGLEAMLLQSKVNVPARMECVGTMINWDAKICPISEPLLASLESLASSLPASLAVVVALAFVSFSKNSSTEGWILKNYDSNRIDMWSKYLK